MSLASSQTSLRGGNSASAEVHKRRPSMNKKALPQRKTSSRNIDEVAERELEMSVAKQRENMSFDMHINIENTYNNARVLSPSSAGSSEKQGSANHSLNRKRRSSDNNRETLTTSQTEISKRSFQRAHISLNGASSSHILSNQNLATLPLWMQNLDNLEAKHEISVEDIKPHSCALYFTSKSRADSCCCCARRSIQIGSIVVYGATSSSGGALIEVEVVHRHQDGTFDVIDEENVEYNRIPKSSLHPRPSSELDVGEVRSRLGCVSIGALESSWEVVASRRTKMKLRAASSLFVLINIVLAIVDSTSMSSSDLKWWVSTGYYNSTAYRNNPFCSHTSMPVSDSAAVSAGSPLDPPLRTARNLIALRSVGVILPSLILMAFSWTSVYKSNKRLRVAVTYFLGAAMASAVGFVSSYKFCNYYQVAYLRRGMFDVFPRIFPRLPGQGLMLLFQMFVFQYMSLPSYISLGCSLVSLSVWYIVSVYQLTSVPIQLSIAGANGIVIFEMSLLVLLCGMCYYQNYARERYARWDFLQKKIIELQRNTLSQNQKTANQLLQSMLPATIIEKLKLGEPIMAEMYNPVTVLFAELCEFSEICALVSPHETVWILNEVFTAWDKITDLHHIHKVETVGEVYMAVSGCPVRISNHAQLAACCALDLVAEIKNRIRKNVRGEIKENLHKRICDESDSTTPTLNAHVGLNTGRINAGVVGTNNPRFKLFGDTVNMASRMESTCPSGCVQVSAATHRCIKDEFVFKDRGLVEIKGKGKQHTYFLEGHLTGAPRNREPIFCQKKLNVVDADKQLYSTAAGSASSKRKDLPVERLKTEARLPSFSSLSKNSKFSEDDDEGSLRPSISVADSTSILDVSPRSEAFRDDITKEVEREPVNLSVNVRIQSRLWLKRARKKVKAERAKWERSRKRHSAENHLQAKRRKSNLENKRHRTRGHLAHMRSHTRALSSANMFVNKLAMIDESTANPEVKDDVSGAVSHVAGVEAIQNLVNKPQGSMHESSDMRGSRSGSVSSKGIRSARNMHRQLSSLSPAVSTSTLGQYCWPELHQSGRRAYQYIRCLTKSEMVETNFDMLQANHSKFQKFQHAKYFQPTVFTVLIYSLGFSLLTWYDRIQWTPIYEEATSVLSVISGSNASASLSYFTGKESFSTAPYAAQLYFGPNETSVLAASHGSVSEGNLNRWKKVNLVFLRVWLRTGIIGSLYTVLTVATLYTRKIPRHLFLATLLLIGVAVIVLCFETGCHGDNTYFVMFATSVYLLAGLPVYGKLGVLVCIATGYFTAGLVMQRLSPAALLDLILIIISLILGAFPQLQQQHYERLNHSQSIELVKSRHEETQESRQIVKLLGKLLPMTVIRELASGRDLIADPYDDVTIIFTDVSSTQCLI